MHTLIIKFILKLYKNVFIFGVLHTKQSTLALHVAIVWFPYTHESFI